MRRLSLILLVFTITAGATHGQESAELQRLRGGYDAAMKRVGIPVTETYLQELKRLKEAFAKSGKLNEALQMDTELQAITARLEGTGAVVSPLGARPGDTAVLNSKATIQANNPDGF